MNRRILALAQLGERRARPVVHVGVCRRQRAQQRRDGLVAEEGMELQCRCGDVLVVLVELVGAELGVVCARLAGRHAHAQEILGELESPRIDRHRIHRDRARRLRDYIERHATSGRRDARFFGLTTQSTRR
jgi:hypothetical protein